VCSNKRGALFSSVCYSKVWLAASGWQKKRDRHTFSMAMDDETMT
jgi:hypothetical protein